MRSRRWMSEVREGGEKRTSTLEVTWLCTLRPLLLFVDCPYDHHEAIQNYGECEQLIWVRTTGDDAWQLRIADLLIGGKAFSNKQ